MTRAFVTAILFGAGLVVASPGCADQGVGDPCIPEQEYDQGFLGFDVKQVNIESKSFQCRTRVCLVNHFRGRASCAYGQDPDGNAPTNATACTVPGDANKKISGLTDQNDPNSFTDPKKKALIEPQCLDRTADRTVYCSCRCADINGQKPSDQIFCDCPDGFTCEPLVTSIGQGNEGLTGSYCIKAGTKYDANTACTQGNCDPNNPKTKCQ